MQNEPKALGDTIEKAQTPALIGETVSSEEVFQQMAAHVQEIFWMMDARSRALVYVSPAYEKICGRSVKPLYQSKDGYYEVVYPEDRERMKLRFQVLPKEAFSDEFRIVRPNGEIRWLLCRGFPVLDDRSEVVRVVGTAQDITTQKEVEGALRLSEDRYRDLVEHSQDLICTHSLEGRLLSVNEPPARILGFSPAELLGRPMREFLSPEVRGRFDEYLETIRRDGVARGLLVVLTKAGQRRIWEYHNTLRTDGVPSPIVRGIAHDVTEQKRAEKALRLSEEKFSKAFRASPTAMAITTFAEGRFVDVNESFELQSGFTQAELCGRTAEEVGIWENSAERRQIMRELRERGSVHRREIRLRTKAGAVRYVVYSAELLELGGERCVLAAGEDITAQKQAEANYGLLVERALYGIVRSTPDGRVLMANSALARMLGYESPAELCTLDIAHDVYVHPEDRARMIQNCCSKESFEDIEVRWKRKDGSTILVRLSGRIVRDDHREIGYFEAMVEDISQRRRLEEQVRQLQRMEVITTLASGLAHDFNHWLTAILGYSERVVMAPGLAEQQRREVEEILRAALQARTLTQQLLAFGGKLMPERAVLNLNALVAEMEPMLRHLVGGSVEFVSTLQAELGGVEADARQLQQVLMNLVVNARDAMPQGGQLTIRTENRDFGETRRPEFAEVEPGRYVVLAVSDTGCGMDEATQARLFEPFFTTKSEGRGTGLGLATVQGIIAQSGGKIAVSSYPGKGTTFRVLLPTKRLPMPCVPSNRVESSQPSNGNPPTILLVEDDDAGRKLLCENLKSQCLVLAARSAEEALKIAQQYPEPIDLLVTDVVLPGLWGRELAERIRALRPETKVLFITGYGEAMEVGSSGSRVAVSVLQKPFLRSELLNKVETILGCSLGQKSEV